MSMFIILDFSLGGGNLKGQANCCLPSVRHGDGAADVRLSQGACGVSWMLPWFAFPVLEKRLEDLSAEQVTSLSKTRLFLD